MNLKKANNKFKDVQFLRSIRLIKTVTYTYRERDDGITIIQFNDNHKTIFMFITLQSIMRQSMLY